MSKIILDLKTLEKLKSIVNPYESRFILSGILFEYRPETKDTILVSTDGIMLGCLRSKLNKGVEPFERFVLRAEDVLSSLAFPDFENEDEYGDMRKTKANLHVGLDTERHLIGFLRSNFCPVGNLPEGMKEANGYDHPADWVLAEGFVHTYKPIDGNYPEYKKVFPNPEDLTGCSEVSFNPKYLSLLSGLGYGDASNTHTHFYMNGKSDCPCVCRHHVVNEGDWVCAIMPMRFDAEFHKPYPDWLLG